MNRQQRRRNQRELRRVEKGLSQPPAPEPQLSHISQADRARGVALLERVDSFSPLRNKLKEIAGERDIWAGIPMPLDGERLVLHPRYPHAEALMQIGVKTKEDDEAAGLTVRNHFWSEQLRREVYIYDDGNMVKAAKLPRPHHYELDLHTLGCSQVWGIEQEANAVQLLGRLLRHHPFKQYLLTGMFLETSARSGVTYMFRRLKPTVALDARVGNRHYHIGDDAATPTDSARILACLCMHPLGYYQGTWAGALTPTDDVVAHLLLMRGDEHLFWKRCTQHHPSRPEAGL